MILICHQVNSSKLETLKLNYFTDGKELVSFASENIWPCYIVYYENECGVTMFGGFASAPKLKPLSLTSNRLSLCMCVVLTLQHRHRVSPVPN